ncbi:MAG: hypothetical protein ACK4K0_01500 [Flavobacteriales bacterium]
MQKIIYTILFSFLLLNSSAQWEEDVKDLTKKERTLFGASAGISFSQFGMYFMGAPSVGYRLSNNILGGVGVKYIYNSFNNGSVAYKQHVYGGSVFAQHNLVSPRFFLHGELEMLNWEARDRFTYNISRRWVPMGFVGAGFRNFYSERSFYQIILLYDLIDDPYSPYPYMWNMPLTLRLGIVF